MLEIPVRHPLSLVKPDETATTATTTAAAATDAPVIRCYSCLVFPLVRHSLLPHISSPPLSTKGIEREIEGEREKGKGKEKEKEGEKTSIINHQKWLPLPI